MSEIFTAMGLMSGTSLDGIDAALIRTDGETQIEFVTSHYVPYTPAFQTRLKDAATSSNVAIWNIMLLEDEFTRLHIDVVQALLDKMKLKPLDVDVLGFHGHTVRHLPEQRLTWQLGDAQKLAHGVGVTTVADFRRADMALGGHGAPLAALYHQACFAGHEKPLGVINVGGVANLTYLGANGAILAGDTGPGMALLDSLIREKTDKRFDENGLIAAAGTPDMALIEQVLQQPFYAAPFPKSADRCDFVLPDITHLSLEDAAATLVHLSAAALVETVEDLPQKPKCLWLTGGGAHHPVLADVLAERTGIVVKKVTEAGYRVDSLEAECFAWLAVRRLLNLPTSVPQTTGCRAPVSGGMIVPV